MCSLFHIEAAGFGSVVYRLWDNCQPLRYLVLAEQMKGYKQMCVQQVAARMTMCRTTYRDTNVILQCTGPL